MIHFIFVHGTFAKSADWPKLQISLAALAKDLGEEVSFQAVLWTGRNSIVARQDAALDLLDKISHTLFDGSRDEPKIGGSNIHQVGADKIIVIAHSHGGSAVAYLLKEFPSYSQAVSGFIFLSTPFIAVRPRLNATEKMAALTFFPASIAYSFIQEWVAPSAGVFSWIAEVSWLQLLLLLSPGLIATVLVWLTRAASERVPGLLHNRTVDLPEIHALFIRFSGDEAAAALSTVQFVSWVAARLSNFLEVILYPPIISIRWLQSVFGIMLATFFSVSAFIVVSRLLPLLRERGLGEIYRVLVEAYLSDGLTAIGVSVALFLTIAFCLIFLMIISVVAVVFLTQALLLKGFGWTGFFEGFAVELAVEPVPAGRWLLTNLDWSLRESGADGLVHSWGYSHPAAIEEMRGFIQQRIAGKRIATSVGA